MALNGQLASFLAGGEFPVPVPQVSATGVAPTITVRFREFGVRLGFVPYVLDGDVIRLTVAPEVSNIDFTIAVTLVCRRLTRSRSEYPQGADDRGAARGADPGHRRPAATDAQRQYQPDPRPGRPADTRAFFQQHHQPADREGAGRAGDPIPGRADAAGQVPPAPGDEVKGPNDLELYFLNRIEGRTGKDFRATTNWDDPYNLRYHLNLEKKYVKAPLATRNE